MKRVLVMKKKKFKVFINYFDLKINDYIIEEIIIETNDIYHEIGSIYCTSLFYVVGIQYFEIK